MTQSLDEGFKCSFCQSFAAGGPVYGLELNGAPVYACKDHLLLVRDSQNRRFAKRRLQKEARRQAKR